MSTSNTENRPDAAEEPKKRGRPLKFKDVKALKKAIDAYLHECDLEEDTRVYKHGKTFEWVNAEAKVELRCRECRGLILDEYQLPTRGCTLVKGRLKEKVPPTITGLALALGCDTDTIKNYEGRPEFFGPIKKAYLRVEQEHELKLHDSATPPAKTIFALTNFKGWENKQRNVNDNNTKHSGSVNLAGLLDAADEG